MGNIARDSGQHAWEPVKRYEAGIGSPVGSARDRIAVPCRRSTSRGPVRTTTALGKHPRPRQAAPPDPEQGRAGSLHPEGYCRVDQTWTEREVSS